MNIADEVLTNIIKWGKGEELVRALVLVGSRAGSEPADELADFDVRVFAHTYEPYIQDDEWLANIGEVWVYIPEKYDEGGEVIPTRLVIYQGGFKVDFAFHTMAMLAKVEWDRGHKIILDKDGIAANIRSSNRDFRRSPPTEKDFIDLVREFWFETYHVAKYLKRDELWLVKFRDWATKELLLKMVEWHAQARHQWNWDTGDIGKNMKAWVPASVWVDLHRAFAHFDGNDSWAALLTTMQLFRRVAIETSEKLGYAYPQDVDRNVTQFILQLKKSSTSYSS